MSTLLISDRVFLGHGTPTGHPERADRLRAIDAALSIDRFADLVREPAVTALLEAVRSVHPQEYAAAIRRTIPTEGVVYFDADTPVSPGSLDAALAAVGSACRAVDQVAAGAVTNAFVAARPPGHHAETARAMGFCLFNTIAIAARHAQAQHGARRIAIVDWDVHHGNGTQQIFWHDADVLFCSTHEMPLYPGTGHPIERGEHGQIANVPLRAGDDGEAFRAAFREAVLPRLHAHAPDFIFISAGFDAHARDPLGNLRLEADDFAWASEEIMAVAERHAGGRLVSLLEGGYDLHGLAQSVAAHVDRLMGA